MSTWITLGLACLLTLSLSSGCGSPDSTDPSTPGTAGESSSGTSSVDGSSSGQTTEDPWGLSLSVKDVTPTGLTLVITQQGGSPTGELQYGSDYTLEVEQDGAWQKVPDIVDGNYAWHDVAYLVTMDGQREETVNWDWLLGPLSPGHYRLSKSFTDFRDTGDYDTQVYQVEFDIP